MVGLRKHIEKLRQTGNYSFTKKQLVEESGRSWNSLKQDISVLLGDNTIISPAEGLYVYVPPDDRSFGSIPPEQLVPIIMKHHNTDYYVALLTAGAYHGATHQATFMFQVICTKRIRHPLSFGDIKIQTIYKKSLEGLPIEKKIVPTGYLNVASPELIAYDILKYRKKSGGVNHIATVLFELLEAIRPQKLIQLAKIIGENAWLQRMGYILEQLDSDEPECQQRIINAIDKYLQKQKTIFIPLAQELPVKGKPRIKKWKIVANTTVESDL